MLNKRYNPVATFFILLTLVGVSKPAKALFVAQNDEVMTSISEALPQETQVKRATSDNAIIINQTGRESFTGRSSQGKVSNTKNSESAWRNRSQNPTDIAAIASTIDSISALNTYTNNSDRDFNVRSNFVADTDDIDKSRSLTNVDRKLIANFYYPEDSGEIAPNLQDSGSVDPNLQDSGQINFDAEGSGDIESVIDLEDSGSVDPNFKDSGSVAPDLKDSGQTISYKVDSNTFIAQVDDNTVAPNGVEGDETTTTRGKWWWWLPLIIGIPVIAAIAVSTFGQKKSDREPAIDNVRDLNTTDRGIGVTGTSGRENLSTLGANVGDVDGLDNTIGTPATSISAATLAEDTTTNFVDDRNIAEDNIELDIDRSNLEDTNSVAEIPSTSVSEFTGYETKLQTSDSSAKLQDNDIDLNSRDDIPPINPIDNVAASELVADLDIEKTTADSVVEVDSEAVTDTTLDTNTEPPNNSIDTATKDVEAKEFKGDFVLEEETQGFTPYQQAERSNVDLTETNQSNDLDLDDRTELSELDLQEPDVAIDEVDSDLNISELQQNTVELDGDRDLDISDRAPSSSEVALTGAANSELLVESDSQPQIDPELVDEKNNETVTGLDNSDGTEVSELDLEEPDVAIDEVDSDLNISELQQDTVELNTNQETIEVIGFDSDRYLEPTPTNSDLGKLDSVNESQRLDNSDRISETSDRVTDDFEVVNISIDEIGFDDTDETVEVSLDEISFDNSELDEISFDDDSTQTVEASLDEISFNELDEISFDDDSTQTVEASLDEISFNELDEISFDDDSSQTAEASLDEISFDESESASTNVVNDSNSDKVSPEKLDEARANLTLDLLSNSTAGITSLSNDELEDTDNITEWLESLETPKQNTDNILEWLDQLNTEDTDSMPHDREVKSEETNDVSFQFIEELLENDDPDRENK